MKYQRTNLGRMNESIGRTDELTVMRKYVIGVVRLIFSSINDIIYIFVIDIGKNRNNFFEA